jgi:hypothetical protein
MLNKIVIGAALLVFSATAPAFAQQAELGVIVGWTFADGASGDPFLAGDGHIYDRLDPKDTFGWGLDVGVYIGNNAEVGFLYGNQPSKLVAGCSTCVSAEKEVGDMKINTYHGYFAYNFGEAESTVRPYILGGFGATNFGSVAFTTAGGASGTVDSLTKFSSTWGAGVKVYPSPHVGVRFGARWTPTYLKTDEAGWWCDPYWGCYLVGNAQYANMFDLHGGVTFRF